METWLIVFVGLSSLAIILQMLILMGMYLQVRQLSAHMTRLSTDLHTRVDPILSRLHFLLEESQEQIRQVVSDAAEITHLAKTQAQKVDRVFSEAVDRLRDQINRADQILTGAMEEMEEAGSQIKRTVLEPVKQATAVLQGIKSGIEFFRTRGRRPTPDRATQQQDEELFI
ncbi:MAG: hypothetical protein HY046_11155 [Acidobacteria bacterium]|nr:hypothetical protein [Acidobacteriota bacterium]